MEIVDRLICLLVFATMAFAAVAHGGALLHLWHPLGDFAPGFPIADTPFGISLLFVILEVKIIHPFISYLAER